MCGLFGIIGKNLNQAHVQAFYDLAIVSMTRGVHSSGLMAYSNRKNKDHKWIYHKSTDDALTMLSTKTAEGVYNPPGRDVTALMGHCRHATVGDHTIENAHPHRAGDIIGMHNGTIPTFARGEHEKEGSDSRVLFKMMNKDGILPALKEARYGAYALSFVDLSTGLVNFIRNKDRPLWYMTNKAKTVFVYASEYRILAFPRFYEYENPKQLPEHTLLTVDPKTLDIQQEDVKAAVSFVHTPLNQPYMGGFLSGKEIVTTEYTVVGDKPVQNKSNSAITVCRTNKTKKFRVTGFRGFAGIFLSLKEAQHLLDGGCANCTKQVGTDDVVHWIDHEQYICDTCRNNDPSTLQYIPNIDEPGNMIVKYFDD